MKKNKNDSTKYIVDVPNYDSEGNDVSGDHPHGGGRRRKDGTLETSTHNYVPLDDYMDDLKATAREEVRDELREEVREELREEMESEREYYPCCDNEQNYEPSITDGGEFWAHLFMTAVSTFTEAIKEGVREEIIDNPEIRVLIKDNIKGRTKTFLGSIIGKKKQKSQAVKQPSKNSSLPAKAINIEHDASENRENKNNITNDEARMILIRMLNNYISLREDYDTLKHAGVINNNRVELNELMKDFDGIIESHPHLLEQRTRNQIRDILLGFEDEKERGILLEYFDNKG